MPQFKSTRVIEAVQWFPGKMVLGVEEDAKGVSFVTTAHHQTVELAAGDWIVAEPNGDGYYPIKSDIFEATYESVE